MGSGTVHIDPSIRPSAGEIGSTSQRSQSMRCTQRAIWSLWRRTASQPSAAMKSMASPATIHAAMSRVPCQSNSASRPSSR